MTTMMTTVMMVMTARARENLEEVRARVALTRATVIRADEDDSRTRVALPWVKRDDDDDDDNDKNNKCKVGAGEPSMMCKLI
jgi:hypothetical protein